MDIIIFVGIAYLTWFFHASAEKALKELAAIREAVGGKNPSEVVSK